MNTQSESSYLPTLEAVITAFDDRRDWVVSTNGSKLRCEYGLLALVPLLVEALPKIRNATGRMHIMFDFIPLARRDTRDRKSTRLNSSHVKISYAVFCLKKKKQPVDTHHFSFALQE